MVICYYLVVKLFYGAIYQRPSFRSYTKMTIIRVKLGLLQQLLININKMLPPLNFCIKIKIDQIIIIFRILIK